MRKRFKNEKRQSLISKYGRRLELIVIRVCQRDGREWGRKWTCGLCGQRYDELDMDSARNHKC